MAQPLLPLAAACLVDAHQGHQGHPGHPEAAADFSAIPATPDVEAGAPLPETPVLDGPVGANTNELPTLLDVSFPQPLPLPLLAAETPFQIHDDRLQFDLNFADALPSTNVSLPTPTAIRTARNLRLPSFDVLGIAAPHPDRISFRSHSFSLTALGAGPLSKPEDPLHAHSPPLDHPPHFDTATQSLASAPKLARPQGEPIISTFTPPSESGTFHWGPLESARPASLGSPPSSDPGVSPGLNVTATATAPGQAPIIVPTPADDLDDVVRMSAWVEEAKNTIIEQSGCIELVSVKVLSHALPCPSITGHLFGQFIAAIHGRTTTSTAWINVFHALPGRYTLHDLPKSPPSTPGPAVGGDEYFTSKVFDSAVAVPDYQLDSKLLPPSPRPVVPPGSINISIVERYIPPTNTNEYAEMFALRGRSLLYDRLSELSIDNGILLFIYPTKTGAKTFMQKYLGPVIEPLLRSVTVVNDLHSELGRNIGQMAAVNYLDEYEKLKGNVKSFLAQITELMDDPKSNSTDKCSYSIIHASKEEYAPNRLAWADDWWIKQEKPRIRDAITKYFRKSKKPTTGELTGANLLQEVIEGVSTREYDDGPPTEGLEVGVFIIQRVRRA
ncbi:hypothetical protein ACEQ8H_003252 [Pleosporales sp. CAS-2024a]